MNSDSSEIIVECPGLSQHGSISSLEFDGLALVKGIRTGVLMSNSDKDLRNNVKSIAYPRYTRRYSTW